MLSYATPVQLLRSVKFNIGLFGAIMLASAVGTFVPQAHEAPERVEVFLRAHPTLGPLLEAAGLLDVYYCRWYAALLLLMALDTVLCTAVRMRARAKEDEPGSFQKVSSEGSQGHPLSAEISVPVQPQEALSRLRRFLSLRGFRSRPVPGRPPDGTTLLVTRHALQWWGTVVAHLSLVVILAGAVVKSLFGFSEFVPVSEGECRAVRNRPGWSLCLDRFTVKYYADTGAPSLFASDLRLMEGGRELAGGRSAVNSPLAVDGVRFYQSGWGAGGESRGITLRFEGKDILLVPGKAQTFPGGALSISLLGFAPDFALSRDDRVLFRSIEMGNPAVRLKLAARGRRGRVIWLLQRFPDIAFEEDSAGRISPASPLPMSLLAVDAVMFSGLEAGYDPGYPLVLGGALAWTVGMLLLFYLHRRRLWISAIPAPGGTTVRIGAWSSRGAAAYKREFDNLMSLAGQEVGR
ncbi:MAG: cytochrome c biogenesis protein ResB [Elusimicrobia bacterium]|nr:cytochrome c biogenesis protein ResB [Elusimicrobiota bacterium]